MENEKILLNSFYEASIPLLPKADKDITRNLLKIILTNIYICKIINKMLVSRIQ